MKQLLIVAALIAMCVSSAGAAIDPANPDWLIYWDPDGEPDVGDPSHYDQYAEVAQGDTLTLHIVVNFNTGDWTQIHSYHSAFWWDPAVVNNVYNGDGSVHPVPRYDWSWMGNMTNPAVAQFEVGNYVQLYNYNYMGSAQNAWEEPAGAPFVLLSWDIPIREDATIGTTTISMRWRSYNINAAYAGPQDWNRIDAHSVETDPAFTINVVPGGGLLGDFDDDGDVDTDDIDLLCNNQGDSAFDVDGDGDADEDDLIFLVENLVELTDGSGRNGTQRGDINLDGLINGTDLALIATGFGVIPPPELLYGDGNLNCDELVNGT